MAHFAQLDENNEVINVIVVNDVDTADENGIENEQIGIDFCKRLFGDNTNWKQTSYNARIRKNYAGIGYTYNEIYDAFIPPKPYESWLFNQSTFGWDPPVTYPVGTVSEWNESRRNWDIIYHLFEKNEDYKEE